MVLNVILNLKCVVGWGGGEKFELQLTVVVTPKKVAGGG